MAGGDQEAALAELRQEIDRIDRSMHGLLMERGRIIDRLISVKGGTAASGSAFRPEREAAMMRSLAARHEGGLPFDAVESIWRIIISTFTHLQAPFSVHADLSGDAAATRDSARFHFGFTVPLQPGEDAAAVIATIAASRGDLGIVPTSDRADTPWWQLLEPESAPKIIACLPFVERAAHPAAHPILVIAKSISGEGLGGTVLYSARGAGPEEDALRGLDGRVIAQCGKDALLALPRAIDGPEAARRLGLKSLAVVGSHPSSASA